MQRRGGNEQPVKGQRRSGNKPKARNAPTAQVSGVDLQEQLDRRTRERDEALEQQSATSEVQEINAAFSTVAKSSAGALLVGGGAFFNGRASQMIGLAAVHAIPASYFRADS